MILNVVNTNKYTHKNNLNGEGDKHAHVRFPKYNAQDVNEKRTSHVINTLLRLQ